LSAVSEKDVVFKIQLQLLEKGDLTFDIQLSYSKVVTLNISTSIA